MYKVEGTEKDTTQLINNLLTSLNFKELISLQYEIIKRIESMVDESMVDNSIDKKYEEVRNVSILDSKSSPSDLLSTSLDNHHKNSRQSNVKREINGSLEIMDDSQDLVLTQYNTNTNTYTPYNSSQLNTQVEEQTFIKEDGSSPLKESQDIILTDVITSGKQNNKNTYHVNNNNSNNKINSKTVTTGKIENSQDFTIKIPSEPIPLFKTNYSPIKKLNFNTNPITKKPWILEDFKPNRQITDVRRGRQKLEQFYSKVGRPNQVYPSKQGYHHSNTNNMYELSKNSSEYLFDNLRHRSRSPPGYGRMDFPSTQERTEDKIKSQRIIYEKTLYRFYAATNSMIPSFEREFLFKKDLLNTIVDDNNFTWSETDLKIFLRSK